MEDDEIRGKKDHDGLMEELADEFTNGEPDVKPYRVLRIWGMTSMIFLYEQRISVYN